LFAKKPTFGNWPSYIHHQANGSAHVDERIESLLNKDNSQVISNQEDSSIDSIEDPTPNMFSPSYSPITSIAAITYLLTSGFSRSKHTIKR
jgi:hypothetical protein